MPPIEVPERIRVLKHATGVVVEMALDEYLQGVTLAEMGSNYPLEALKAQAIAARSFALSASKHGARAQVCTDHGCCQAWKADHAPLPDRAVAETRGLVLTFGDAIATPFYFGHCDGRTRNFEDVWSSRSPVPYCRGVPCICGHTQMKGHGVGMCQEGARAMAERGATADEILTHYYAGVAIIQAGPARSVIQVVVKDAADVPQEGQAVTLVAPGFQARAATNPMGAFVFARLRAGTYRVAVPGTSAAQDVTVDGTNRVVVSLVVPAPAVVLGVIRGVVRDSDGAPQVGCVVLLTGEGQTSQQETDAQGRYRFAPLPAGTYRVTVADTDVTADGLFVDGFSETVVDLTVPAPVPPWTMQVETRPGPRAIAGTFPRAGIPVTISDPWGNHWLTTSGDKLEHGVGGFEVLLWFDTTYTVRFLDQEFSVPVDGTFEFLTFEEASAPPVEKARLVSRWMAKPEARAWLDRFEGYATYRGRFTLEEGAPAAPVAGTAWTVDVETRPAPRAIAGTFPRAGIPVIISDPWGNHWLTTSGDKLEHGVGGFEILLWFDTTYMVSFLDQEFSVEVDGTFKFLTFTADVKERARLASDWLPEDQVQKWYTRFEAMVTYRGLFDIVQRPSP